MYRIGRIRAASIGPNDARFDRPSARVPIFELDLTSQRQPADSIVWLENGGGKTVFLTLLFHVLRPDRAASIGDEHGKRGGLDDFVLADDVGHVQVEWIACTVDGAPTGERIITGLVAERRSRTGDDRIEKTWYALVVRDNTVSIDDLKTEADGRRIPKRVFVENLRDLAQTRGRKSCDLRTAEAINKWLAALTEIGLDPALLDYQVGMNRKEGGAASLFRFSSDEKFLEFLLGLVIDPEALDRAGETLSRVAEKIASLPGKQRELAFAEGALVHLDTMATSYAGAQTAEGALSTSQAEGQRLRRSLVLASEDADRGAKDQQLRAKSADERATAADRQRRTLDDERRLLAIEVAEFVANDATKSAAEADEAANDAAVEVHAWNEVPLRVELDQLRSRTAALTQSFDELEQKARPIKKQRDEAGAGLRGRLLADGLMLRNEALTKRRAQHDLETAAKEHRSRAKKLSAKAGEARGEAKSLQSRVDSHTAARERAVSAGHLLAGEEPAGAVTRLAGIERPTLARINEIDGERTAAATRRPALERALSVASSNAAAADQESLTASANLERLRKERARFSSMARIAELVGVVPGEVDVEVLGGAVVERLEESARSADHRRIDAEVLAASDRRAIESLEGGAALLPPRPEVTALLDRLGAAGLAATSGWRHLADAIAPANRERVLTAYPELVDGVVLPRAQWSAAVAALDGVVMRPTAAIVVGTKEALESAESSSTSIDYRFVLPPAPGLYDRAQARNDLGRLQERFAQFEQHRSALDNSARSDRSVAAELRQHLDRWPVGSVATLTHHASSAAAKALAEAQKRDDCAAEVEKLAHEDADRIAEQAQLRQRLTALNEHLGPVRGLVAESILLSGASERLSRLRAEAEQQETEAAALESAADAMTDEASSSNARAAELELIASQRKSEALGVSAPPHADEALLAADNAASNARAVETAQKHAGGKSAPELRAAFETFDRALTSATTGSQVAFDLRTARDQLTVLDRRWGAVEPGVATRAEKLLTTPHAADPVALAAAKKAAEAQLKIASGRSVDAATLLQIAIRDRKALPPPERVSARLERQSATIEEARQRHGQTEADYARTIEERGLAEVEREAANHLAADLDKRSKLLAQQSRLVATALGEANDERGTQAAPFSGTLDDAQEMVDRLTRRLSELKREFDEATKRWMTAAQALTSYARDEQWSELSGFVYRRLASETAAQLGADSSDLLTQLRLFKGRIEAELASMDEHRKLLVTSLADLVGAALSSLRQATSRSRLPDQLGDWSNRPFLKIEFESPSETDIEERLGTFVVELIRRPRDKRPEGAKLLTQATISTIAGGAQVSVLKPSKTMALKYVPIAEMAILSGGMRATAAIAMFCTLARLRAANRATQRDRGVAALILDNPFGDASAVYLVSLQRLVAHRAGIQLIFTTGIKDYDALRLFPNPIRLSNLTAKRAGLAYVTGDPVFIRQLWPEGEDARISTTRISRVTEPRLAP